MLLSSQNELSVSVWVGHQTSFGAKFLIIARIQMNEVLCKTDCNIIRQDKVILQKIVI